MEIIGRKTRIGKKGGWQDGGKGDVGGIWEEERLILELFKFDYGNGTFGDETWVGLYFSGWDFYFWEGENGYLKFFDIFNIMDFNCINKNFVSIDNMIEKYLLFSYKWWSNRSSWSFLDVLVTIYKIKSPAFSQISKSHYLNF